MEVKTEMNTENKAEAENKNEFGATVVDMGKASFAGEWKRRSSNKHQYSTRHGGQARKRPKVKDTALSRFAKSVASAAGIEN